MLYSINAVFYDLTRCDDSLGFPMNVPYVLCGIMVPFR